jgi:DNA mismatch repair protein MutS2
MGELKVFAHEADGIENGSMAFDQKTLKPSYRFQMGIPGSSYAFEIAGRLGLSEEIVADARGLMGEERGKVDRLVLHLEEQLHRTQSLLRKADIKESELSGLVALYRERVEKLRKDGEEEKKKILNEAEAVLHEANAAVEKVVKEIREKQADRESIRAAKKRLSDLRRRAGALSKGVREVSKPSFAPGDWVVWPGHGGRGEVVSSTDGQGRILVQWNDVKLRIPVEELRSDPNASQEKETARLTLHRVDNAITDEVDLRGMTVDEAIEAVDKYLGDASTAGLTRVRIIHGKGTGTLRREIGRHLKGHRCVKQQRLGHWNEGDTGVTVVDLK